MIYVPMSVSQQYSIYQVHSISKSHFPNVKHCVNESVMMSTFQVLQITQVYILRKHKKWKYLPPFYTSFKHRVELLRAAFYLMPRMEETYKKLFEAINKLFTK